MRQAEIESYDGTRIVYRVGGSGERWLVVANGYGGTFCAWDDVFARLGERYRLLIWDYRGLHRSGAPAELERLRIEDNCRDLDCIREVEGIERFALAGWSVGVQVALEHYRRAPERVEALILINGAHGRVLRRSTRSRVARSLLPTALRGLRAAAPVLSPVLLPPLRALAGQPWSGAVLRRAGVFNGESPSLTEAARAVLALDYVRYTHMILLADQHDAADVLGRVAVPAMVVAGDRDMITPPALARTTAEGIPGCRYREIAGATHYGVMEYPDRYAAYIEEMMAASERAVRSTATA